MKIAIPLTNSELSLHFGHCEKFAIYHIENGKIQKEEIVDPPMHEPGSHPNFLNQLGVSVVITGGMGIKAQQLMQANGIEVIVGVCPMPLKDIVEMYLKKSLEAGNNLCDH
ncbi:MAG: NifB/NifX family molybdenum-iron cluster-binding protein [Candidatus Cloacimonetes bacterium]|nr:NifB/NifX family molybdenum-iron cluster-binding protein [Candidatus Cloacimonadota bacterium]MDY0298308.1 NifB/NifX family molybdenum-iron cluster-binding protein [Candidatus Cloacimonadaceae bacterium]MCB5278963.1 NifB/NifX family molybdenum-iron cluster-binding protein [Candidatus Cloacimonadota bacterium]MCK9331707.1 NifB/NifX family molybdenum-iron cluster-binding protein [Candidatus Cloacimonadota bacterium]MDD2209952.1 NifB/NifX family molybdenum-iron cluster-binding protein [Candidat